QQLISSLDIIQETQVEQEREESEKDRAFFRVLNEIGIPRTHIDRSFFAAGGSSLNALLFVAKLHQIGFNHITVERLMNAKTLQEILLDQTEDGQSYDLFFEHENKYQTIPLEQVDEVEARRIIIESFTNMGEIDVLRHRNCP